MLYKLIFLLSICLLAIDAQAIKLTLLDNQGRFVSDAIVSLTKTATSTKPPTSELSEPVLPVAKMDQQNKQFVPHVLLISKGQKVSFPNSDNIRHHVYSFSNTKRFEIKLYADTPKEPVLFDQDGIVILGCNIHDTMLGYIYVAGSPYTAFTNAEGFVQFNIDNEEGDELLIWHPRMKNPSQTIKITGSDLRQDELQLQIELDNTLDKKIKKSRWR